MESTTPVVAPFVPFTNFFDAITAAQRIQWQATMAWYQSVLNVQQELWDEWVCHCAGGVPIDG